MDFMTSIKGHFDGHGIVLDEPAMLAVGQEVRVIVDSALAANAPKCELGVWKGKLQILDEGDDVILDHFKDYLP